MANIVIPFAAVALAVVPSAGFNNNFTEIASKFNTYAVQTDVAKVITVSHTWNASQTMGGDLLFADALYDIGKTGATRPRDGFFSRNLTVGGAITGALTLPLTQDLTFTDATYDIGKNGATRPRDGFFSRNFTVGGILLMGTIQTGGAAAGDIVLQNSSWLRGVNAANTAALGIFAIDGANRVLFDLNQGGSKFLGNIILGLAATQIVGPATSTSFRNAANGADNLLIADAGVITLRNTLVLGGSPSLQGDVLFADALYDIGKTGATRPRHGFFSGNITLGGQLDVGTGHVRQGTSTAGVAAVATAIYSMGTANSALVLVIGNDGTNFFQDLVAHAPAKAPQVISSFTVSGAPAARTYTSTTTPLLLAMASGTYTIKTLPFEVI